MRSPKRYRPLGYGARGGKRRWKESGVKRAQRVSDNLAFLLGLSSGRRVGGRCTLAMQIQFTDFNNAQEIVTKYCEPHWSDLREVLTAMPLHLKASDQDRIRGKPIFDPVGTNRRIADHLGQRGWQAGIVIP